MTHDDIPAWVLDIIGLVRRSDESAGVLSSGYPSVCRTFRDHVTSEDDGSYSRAEIEAARAAMEWMSRDHPKHWRALCVQGGLLRDDVVTADLRTPELAAKAAQMFDAYVDSFLDWR